MSQKKDNINKSGYFYKSTKKLVVLFLVFCTLILLNTINLREVKATAVPQIYGSIDVSDKPSLWTSISNWAKKFGEDAAKWAKEGAGSKALQAAIYNSLQYIAHDTATWIGSGGKGQKPLFIREGWGEYLTNIADNAAGEFIESFSKGVGLNLCEPSAGARFRIGLGLVQYARPSEPECTFSEMKNNWESELQRPDFLSRFQNMFEPTQSDLGIALTAHTRLIEKQNFDVLVGEKGRIEDEGWLRIDSIGGKADEPPGEGRSRLDQVRDAYGDKLGTFTGQALIDAMNVFLNQLAITLFNNLMSSIGKSGDTFTSPYSGDYGGLGDYEAGPTTSGIAGAKDKFRKLIEADFSVRGDYDILAELTQCNNPNKAGPTNCVITENFRQAITNKMTVGEAMKQGYLNPNGVFGFTSDGLEPSYNEGYPYRSMIILRKFRIIPVGWEVAAQFIKDRPNRINGTKNLEDLINCFDPADDYEGYYNVWCDGLVDPTWVLKASLNYCKREGPGPEIVTEQIMGQDENSKLAISRNDNYCADEQSCIKEYDDGSCQFYGYCTEERRKWDFNGESCEPIYNTCQTFRSRDPGRGGAGGKTVSYLENTLDYSYCSVDNAGCNWYCMDYDVNAFAAIQRSLVSHWPFEDITGGITPDIVGVNDGQLMPVINPGVTQVSGIVGKALSFDGSTGYVEVASNISLDITNEITMDVWIKPRISSTSDEYHSFLFKPWAWDFFGIHELGTTYLYLQSIPNWFYNVSFNYFDGNWHNIVGTYDAGGGTDNMKMYIDGKLSSSTKRTGFIGTSANDLIIGGHPVYKTYTGLMMDEVKIYNRALSPSEVYTNYINSRFSGQWLCTETSGNKLYLDKEAEECSSSEEGCHEFIRTKPGIGANLLQNSSFEDYAGVIDDIIPDTFTFWSGIGVGGLAVSDSYYNSTALELQASIVNIPVVVGPTNYSVGGQAYTLSFYAKNCGNTQNFGIDTSTSILDTTADWQYFKITHTYPSNSTGNIVIFTIQVAGSCLVDAIKLERGIGTPYDEYRDNGLVYEKSLPSYLDNVCYENPGTDYSLKSNAPSECYNFARQCNGDEVGCELYTSTTDGMSIPAKVTAQDYCPAECVGYDTYIQKDTTFDSLRDSYFIPSTAKSCSAGAVGCDEFTNLDTVAKGGEGREYYIYLRQCIKPSTTACADFYTWEGSNETGYQLRVFQLKNDTTAPVDTPFVVNINATYNGYPCQSINDYDPVNNPMCREFYNSSGGIFYRFYHHTITCSDDCFPYRRTENNIDPNLTDPNPPTNGTCGANGDGSSQYAGTLANQFNWDATLGVCYFCKNGGYWDSGHYACLYDAIPGEGKTCSSGQAGCRDYSGNTGNNMMTVFTSDFEGSAQGWQGAGATGAVVQNESLMVGGQSLEVSGGSHKIEKVAGSSVKENGLYVLKFIAKSIYQPASITAEIGSGIATSSFTGTANLVNSEWRIYELNLAQLNHKVSAIETIVISGSDDFYIDDIRLIEIIDRYYLLKNSWNTPASCFEDIAGNPVGPLYNLGCDEYYDRDNNTHYLHSFSQLCQESAVGCELMIDTHNYSKATSDIFNDADGDGSCDTALESDCLFVPADNYIYAVYDQDKQCSRDDKGCQFLGESYEYEGNTLFSDIYLKNNPDKYNSILCNSDEVGCEEWATSEGISYFKDPGDQACEWRQGFGLTTGSWGWYKKKIKRCDDDGSGDIGLGETAICFYDSNCGGTASCIIDENDYSCPATSFKTFGYGGAGNRVKQPRDNIDGFWAGLCPADQSSCREYIDPISRFSINIIFNADFSQDVDIDNTADGWSALANGIQNIGLEPNTLYVLAVEGNNTVIIETFDKAGNPTSNKLITFDPAINSLLAHVPLISISSTGQRNSMLFYTDIDVQNDNVVITVQDSSYQNGSRIELGKAVIDYQLKSKLDKESCNGIVDFEEGCVLFNERSQNGMSKTNLIWDADLTYYDGTGITPRTGSVSSDNDSNTLLKVSPDRTCNKWLACRSIVATKDEEGREKNVCFDIGSCDKIDEDGYCENFVLNQKIEQSVNLPGSFSKYNNTTGYSKVGLYGIADDSMKGNYPLGKMEQFGEIARVPNGNFEIVGNNNYPIGWNPPKNVSWTSDIYEVIDNPAAAQTEGIGYAPEGKNFLKLGSTYSTVSEYVDVVGSMDYAISAYINTINLNNGQVQIKIEELDSSDNPTVPAYYKNTYNKGKDWGFSLETFTTANLTSKLIITLESTSNTVGNYYFDDIRIRPALNVRFDQINSKEQYRPQSCRLYPETDSLSCEYFEDSGIYKKGWWGYCLEYDRYPGSEDACVLWWPVDKVKGDGIEEGAGYNDRYPVYYCTQGMNVPTSLICDYSLGKGHGADCAWGGPNCSQGDIHSTPFGADVNYGILKFNVPFGFTIDQPGWDLQINWPSILNCNAYRVYITDDLSNPWFDLGPVPSGGQGMGPSACPRNGNSWATWYDFAGSPYSQIRYIKIAHVEDNSGDDSCDTPGVALLSPSFSYYCDTLAQTVTPAGQNKYWSGRVYKGSNYSISCNIGVPGSSIPICNYLTDYSPFGSIFPPAPDNNPYEWDSKSAPGIQPLYLEPDQGQPRMGQLYTQANASRLFAKSYGSWSWSSKFCVGGTFNGVYCTDDTNHTDCAGTCDNYCISNTIPKVYGGLCTGLNDCIPYSDSLGNATCAGGFCDNGCKIGQGCASDADCLSSYCESSTLKCFDGYRKGLDCNTGGLPDDSKCAIPNCFSCGNTFMSCSSTICSGGVNNGISCFSNNDCPGGTCSESSCTTDIDCSGTCSGTGVGRYIKVKGSGWGPPNIVCPGLIRPAYPGDYCAIPPIISNIKVNNFIGEMGINKNGFVNLTYNSKVDIQQLPMVMYAIDWGDNEATVVTGMEMRDKSNVNDPHALYHLYNYWDLKAKNAVDQDDPATLKDENTVYCGTAGNNVATNYNNIPINITNAPSCNFCVVKPEVKVKDNWGWCNSGVNIGDCSNWETYSGMVVVTENCNYSMVKYTSCGDGVLQAGEACDDGANGNNFDRCYDDCTFTYCGDGIVQKPNGQGFNEDCDDNNNNPGDGCSAVCILETPITLIQAYNLSIPDCTVCQTTNSGVCIDNDGVPGDDSCSWDITSYAYASSTVDAVGFYNYDGVQNSNTTEPTLPKSDRSELFVFTDQVTNVMSIGILHDFINDGTGGNVVFDFTDITGSTVVSAADDPLGGGGSDPDSYKVGDSLNTGNLWNWSWAPGTTDGGMISFPAGSNWSVTIAPTFNSGINNWIFAIGSNTSWIDLDRSTPVTIKFQ